MKAAGYLLLACIALAAFQALAGALVLAIILGIIVAAVTRPNETLGLLTFLLIGNLVQLYPLPSLMVIGGALLLALRNLDKGA